MKLTEIKHTTELATAVCITHKRPVVIEKSISYIYQKNIKTFNEVVEEHYYSLTWKNKIEFGLIESLLLGLPIDEMGECDIDNIVIRFGWISQDMLQLEWIPIRHLLDKYLNGELTPTEKNKFQNICRTLAIPMKKMSARRKEYLKSKQLTQV